MTVRGGALVSALLALVIPLVRAELVDPVELKARQAMEEAQLAAVDPTATDVCTQFTSCSECVFDASLGLMDPYYNCTWCPNTKACTRTVDNTSLQCAAARYQGGANAFCREMQCVAAQDWTNIYFCRPQMRAALCTAALLLLLSAIFYFLWLRAIRQKPWRYGNIHDAVDEYVNSTVDRSRFLKELRTGETSWIQSGRRASRRPPHADAPQSQPEAKMEEVESDDGTSSTTTEAPAPVSCHICKIRSDNVDGDGVCFWCNVARLAFLPLTVALTASIITIVLIFFVGLKPWFATPYYLVILSLGYGGYGVFFFVVHNYRVPVAGDPKSRLSSFIHLAIVLRGRALLDVLPTLVETKDTEMVAPAPAGAASVPIAAPPPKSPPAPPATTILTMSLRHGDHTPQPGQSIGGLGTSPQIGASLPPMGASIGMLAGTSFYFAHTSATVPRVAMEYPTVRQSKLVAAKLRQEIPEDSREQILWSFEPEREVIFTDNFWIFHFFFSITAVGLWLVIASQVDASWSIFNVVSSGLLAPVGCILALFGTLALYHLYHGLARLYVLTPKRLMIIIQNGNSGAITSDTPIEMVRCASIQTYMAFTWSKWDVVVHSFSWTAPEEGRRLPPIHSNVFAGLTSESLIQLREKFDSVVKSSINSSAIKSDFSHLRTSWKINIAISMLIIWLIPVFVFQAYFVPPLVAVLGLVAVGSMPVCMIYRGYRMHKLSVIGHDVSKEELNLPSRPIMRNMRNIVSKIVAFGAPLREGLQAVRALPPFQKQPSTTDLDKPGSPDRRSRAKQPPAPAKPEQSPVATKTTPAPSPARQVSQRQLGPGGQRRSTTVWGEQDMARGPASGPSTSRGAGPRPAAAEEDNLDT